MGLVGYFLIFLIIAILLFFIKRWISSYNQFQRWKTDSQQKFSDVKILTRQRLAMLDILSQIAQRYTDHEIDTFEDVTRFRSRLLELEGKKTPIDEQAAEISDIEGTIEDYPNLEAGELYDKLMGEANIGEIEERFRRAARSYNQIVERYNYHTKRFPSKIVANFHNFEPLEYITFPEEYEETDLFGK